jgi:putative holliday junction resolvase
LFSYLSGNYTIIDPMRLMAIDYGEKRVGIASTDDSGRFALPRFVWPNDGALLGKILKFRNEENIDAVVMGESKNFSGDKNQIQGKIEKFKKELEDLGIKVFLHPEVLTTVEARRLQGGTSMTDASAAALILKSFLDTMYNKAL